MFQLRLDSLVERSLALCFLRSSSRWPLFTQGLLVLSRSHNPGQQTLVLGRIALAFSLDTNPTRTCAPPKEAIRSVACSARYMWAL